MTVAGTRNLEHGTAGSRAEVLHTIETTGVVAVIRLREPELLQGVVDALMAGGVRALEVTMTVPRAVELIAGLAKTLPPEFVLGAGTVLDAGTARHVIEAGARFVVSPVFKPDVIAVCREQDVVSAPGCFTPTEILTAWEAGADVVKVFPATALGPGFFKDVLAPLPHVKLMPTGGVTKENAGEWIKAGAVALGVGTAMVEAKAVAERRFDVVTENARLFVNAVKQARDTQARSPRPNA
jgi:2-dehydro-3-deoxyphosphogluconate aldolase/(4S)-4-hydroxy-2-oxoglutarate aldolase